MAITTDRGAIEFEGAARTRRHWGLAAAIASTAFGLLYLLGLGINLLTSGSPYPSGADVRTISAGIALAWNVVLLILFAALRREAHPSKEFLAELGWVFAIQVCIVSCASWFLGLTSSTLLAQGGNFELAELANPYNPSSPAYALEHLGWGLFFGLAAVFTGLALRKGEGTRSLGRILEAAGLLSLLHFIGIIVRSEPMTWLGFIAWGILLPVSSAIAAGYFRRRLRPTA
jgi:hypothetical protein